MTKQDEDLDLGRVGNFLSRHPEFGPYWLGIVCTIYLAWQIVPGLRDPASRWAYIIFMVPLAAGLLAISIATGKLMKLTQRLDQQDAERARLQRENDELERKALNELNQQRAGSASAEGNEVVPPATPAPPEIHHVDECPGPQFFPEDSREGHWVDETCGAFWQWRGDRWVQA